MRVLLSGGGTGGHVFPAIAIAKALKKFDAGIEILFVGAEGKMEMQAVPKAGFDIVALPVRGFQRRLTWRNLDTIRRLLYSLRRVRRILKDFRPDVVVGTGGYASAPALKVAQRLGIPTVVQEQNSYAGVTNKLLGRRAQAICVAYEGMDRFFPKEKIVLTGNPVRADLTKDVNTTAAYAHFDLDPGRKTVLVMGGSLGARTINEAIEAAAPHIAREEDVQVLWQMGRLYRERFVQGRAAKLDRVRPLTFIDRMDYAYRVADVAVCRAGALTLSELMVTGVPAVLVPSPNVAEDHQTKNARTLVSHDAAAWVPDQQAREHVWDEALRLLRDDETRHRMSKNLLAMAKKDAADAIARVIIKLARQE